MRSATTLAYSSWADATGSTRTCNGASHVGQRPVIVDRRLIQGQLLIMETYCPDELDTFRDEVEDLKFDDVIKS